MSLGVHSSAHVCARRVCCLWDDPAATAGCWGASVSSALASAALTPLCLWDPLTSGHGAGAAQEETPEWPWVTWDRALGVLHKQALSPPPPLSLPGCSALLGRARRGEGKARGAQPLGRISKPHQGLPKAPQTPSHGPTLPPELVLVLVLGPCTACGGRGEGKQSVAGARGRGCRNSRGLNENAQIMRIFGKKPICII